MTLKYARLRKQIFDQEVKQVTTQIRQVGILLLVFLSTAVPALFFAMLLGFGIVLNNSDSALGSLIIVWGMLLSQSMLLLPLKKAIIGCEYKMYLISLGAGMGLSTSVTVFLTLYCQPFFLIHVFILGNVDPSRWADIPHGFLFLALQVACTILLLYRESAVNWFLGLSFFWLGLASYFSTLANWTLLQHLFIFGFLCLLSVLLPRKVPAISISFSPFIRIWVNQFFAQRGLVQFQLSVTLLISIMTLYCNLQLPQYAIYINFIGAQIIVLTSASVQLMVNKQIAQYAFFFSEHMLSPTRRYYQYLTPILSGALMLFIFALMQQQPYIWFVHMFALMACIAVAKRRGTALVFGWLIISGLLVACVF